MDPHKESDDIDEAQAAAILGAAAKDKPSDGAAGSTPASASSAPSASGVPAPVNPLDSGVPGATPPAPARQPNFTPSPVSAVAPDASSTSPMNSGSPATGQPPVSPSPADIAASSFAPDAASNGKSVPKKSKKPMLIAIIAVAVVCILLGASAAAYYVVMNKPQNVLNTALVNEFSKGKVNSVNFEGNIDYKPKGSNTVSTTFTGASNNDGAFTVSAKVDAVVTTIKVDLESADGKSYYLRLGGLDGVDKLLGMGGASEMAPAIAGINNQWLEITQGMLKQLTGTDTDVSTKLSDADRQKLADAYKKNQFLVVSKTLKDENIKGKSSRHYQVTIDKTKLKNFAAAVKAANISSLKMTGDNLKSFNEEADKTDFGKYPVDVWVSKSDKLINQVAFQGTDQGNTYSLRFTITDFNKPVTVQPPKDAKSLLEVLSALLSGSFSDMSGSDTTDNMGLGGLGGISL